MLDVNEKFDESSTCSEIKEFFMFLWTRTGIDPLRWWLDKKFLLIVFCHLSVVFEKDKIIAKSSYCFFDKDWRNYTLDVQMSC
jgi:hypothetical protein